jgi:pimeloyl-ACP methyl ester carboxylesterase
MQTLFLLHGAIGAAGQLQPLARNLEDHYKVHTLDFAGHGGRDMPVEPFSIARFADDVLEEMAVNGLDKISVFGYSMGGYVAMYLAKHHPEKIDSIVTLATKFHWDEATAAKEVQMVNAEKITQKLPAFAETLAQRHAPNDWRQVMARTADMLTVLGQQNTMQPDDYTVITHPVLVMLGDRDKMVGLEETLSVYKNLPNAQMAMLPATGHPIEQADVSLLGFLIRRFVTQ